MSSRIKNNKEYKNVKNYFSELSIKMFIKRKTRAEKAYTYRMLLSFQAMVTYQKLF